MLGSVKLTLPANTRRRRRNGMRRNEQMYYRHYIVVCRDCVLLVSVLLCYTCGGVRLGYGVYSVHVYYGLVLLLPLQGEHHLSQGVGDPPPLQDDTWQRVQRAQLLENILPTSF